MAKRKPIDYDEIEKSNVLVLSYDKPVSVKFLDEGTIDSQIVIDERTEQEKEVPKYVYQVADLKDNNKEKELSFLAKTFVIAIKEHKPFKDKSFQISKFHGIDKFDIDYRIVPLD